MSIIYRPINGLAGTATFILRQSISTTRQMLSSIKLLSKYATFDEEDVDSILLKYLQI